MESAHGRLPAESGRNIFFVRPGYIDPVNCLSAFLALVKTYFSAAKRAGAIIKDGRFSFIHKIHRFKLVPITSVAKELSAAARRLNALSYRTRTQRRVLSRNWQGAIKQNDVFEIVFDLKARFTAHREHQRVLLQHITVNRL